MKNHIWVIEQRYKRTWYPFLGEVEKREANYQLRTFIEGNPNGKDSFRLRKYEAVEEV